MARLAISRTARVSRSGVGDDGDHRALEGPAAHTFPPGPHVSHAHNRVTADDGKAQMADQIIERDQVFLVVQATDFGIHERKPALVATFGL